MNHGLLIRIAEWGSANWFNRHNKKICLKTANEITVIKASTDDYSNWKNPIKIITTATSSFKYISISILNTESSGVIPNTGQVKLLFR